MRGISTKKRMAVGHARVLLSGLGQKKRDFMQVKPNMSLAV
jgi:hypothetical protein